MKLSRRASISAVLAALLGVVLMTQPAFAKVISKTLTAPFDGTTAELVSQPGCEDPTAACEANGTAEANGLLGGSVLLSRTLPFADFASTPTSAWARGTFTHKIRIPRNAIWVTLTFVGNLLDTTCQIDVTSGEVTAAADLAIGWERPGVSPRSAELNLASCSRQAGELSGSEAPQGAMTFSEFVWLTCPSAAPNDELTVTSSIESSAVMSDANARPAGSVNVSADFRLDRVVAEFNVVPPQFDDGC